MITIERLREVLADPRLDNTVIDTNHVGNLLVYERDGILALGWVEIKLVLSDEPSYFAFADVPGIPKQ